MLQFCLGKAKLSSRKKKIIIIISIIIITIEFGKRVYLLQWIFARES